MQMIYIAQFFSTGERWNSIYCANREAALRVVSQNGCTENTTHDIFVNPKDRSQTATIIERALVE
jgi:hypothetical protein